MSSLSKYQEALKRIKRGVTKYGKAPHKIILLISVIQLIRTGRLKQNQIFITPEILMLFKSNWSAYVKTDHVCNFSLPFWHLKTDKFWHLRPKSGFESVLNIKESVSSLNELNATVNYASLDNDLYEILTREYESRKLEEDLIRHFFPESQEAISPDYDVQRKIFDEIENKILTENPTEYAAEIKGLLKEKNEEEIFLRGCIFKRQVPKIYKYTCSISGLRIESDNNISMIDACHIKPFSESYDDTITNGIALCPNLHRAFDRGLISVDDEYRVLVSDNFSENESDYSLKKFDKRPILLPDQTNQRPLAENLAWHRNNIFRV